jgi:HK97 family phage prohead protease
MLIRAALADLEIRGDGRTICGLACPFDRPTEIRDVSGSYREMFRPGAFARTIRERGDRVRLLAQHDAQRFPLGRATRLTEDARGLVMEARVSATVAGDEVLALVADGALDGLSVGFQPVRDAWSPRRDSVERLEVRLMEISVVTAPAFDDARILAVRSTAAAADRDPSVWATRLRVPANPNSLDAWARRLGVTP